MKKEMEWKWKDLKGLEATISEYESHLRGGCEDNSSNSGSASKTSMKKGPKSLHWRDEEDRNQPDDGGSQLAVKTPEGPFLEAYFINL